MVTRRNALTAAGALLAAHVLPSAAAPAATIPLGALDADGISALIDALVPLGIARYAAGVPFDMGTAEAVARGLLPGAALDPLLALTATTGGSR